MASKPQNMKELTDIVLEELDIRWAIKRIFEKGLAHPEAVKNQNMIDGTFKPTFNLAQKQERDHRSGDTLVRHFCWNHDCKSDTPAAVYLEKNTFKCFKCGLGPLDVVDAIKVLVHNADPRNLRAKGAPEFIPAMKTAVEIMNEDEVLIEYDFDARKQELTPEQLRALKVREVLQLSGEFYHKLYKEHPRAFVAQKYMRENRAFKNGLVPYDEIVDTYKIGYAPSDYPCRVLYEHLASVTEPDGKTRRYSDEDMIAAGVAFMTDGRDKDGNQTGEPSMVDRYRNGVIIPYFSRGKIVNLYMRTLNPKALPENRHRRLPGAVDEPVNFDEARHYREAMLFEGEISMLSIRALGFKNLFANRGTQGMKPSHIAMLKRYREESNGERLKVIYLCYDPDAKEEAVKTGDDLEQAGFEVRVIQLPEEFDPVKGKPTGDPNEFLQRGGTREKFQELIDAALSFQAYKMLWLVRTARKNSEADKIAAIRSVRELAFRLPQDEIEFVAKEVGRALDTSWERLLKYWDQQVYRQAPKQGEIPGIAEAVRHNWIVVFDNAEMYEAIRENGILSNVALVTEETAAEFAEKVKSHAHIGNLVLNANMSKSVERHLTQKLSDFRFKTLSETGLEWLQNCSDDEFVSSCVPLEKTAEKAAS